MSNEKRGSKRELRPLRRVTGEEARKLFGGAAVVVLRDPKPDRKRPEDGRATR